MSTTACVIQARRQSTRLPDKILKPLGGKPVLQHVIERCQRIRGVGAVIVASPEGAFEDPVETLARQVGALTFRGDMNDVLSRYWGAAQLVPCDYVMRVTADCPLLDPDICARLIDKVQAEGADYGGLGGWPHGLDCEVFTHALLDMAHATADKAVDREHVTLWMKAQPGLRRTTVAPEGPSLTVGNRWVVDYPEDFTFMTALFDRLPQDMACPGYSDVLAVVNAHPDLRAINSRQEEAWGAANVKLYAASGQVWRRPT